MPYRKVKFVFTPTDEKAPVTHNDVEDGYFLNPMSILAKHRMGKCTNAHMHIIMDGDVKVGEVYYNTASRKVEGMCKEAKEAEEYDTDLKKLRKRIVSSTDEGMKIPYIIPVELLQYCIKLDNQGFRYAEIDVLFETLFDKPENASCETCHSFIGNACRQGCGTISCYGYRELKYKYWTPKDYRELPETPKTINYELAFRKEKESWDEEELLKQMQDYGDYVAKEVMKKGLPSYKLAKEWFNL